MSKKYCVQVPLIGYFEIDGEIVFNEEVGTFSVEMADVFTGSHEA